MLGPDRHQAGGRLPAHSRIHLFVRRGLSKGRDVCLSDHAEIGYGVLPGLPHALSRKFARQDILLVLDGAPNHRCRDLVLPGNISLLFLPPYSPELNPKENLWEEIREKIFKNYALKSIDAVRTKLKQAIFYIECNPETVKSITSFPYSIRIVEMMKVFEMPLSLASSSHCRICCICSSYFGRSAALDLGIASSA